jgi:hypothetical protein
MMSVIRRLLAILTLSSIFFVSRAQSSEQMPEEKPGLKKSTKPFKIVTAGKQITIKSSKNIQQVMLWTTDGHRVIEQRDINAGSFSFKIPVNAKIFFLMVELNDGKIYTEKIGLQ